MGAKYIAQTLGVPLYHLDISGLKNKYVGASEDNLQAALAQIDQVEPCVVLIDEVEKIFAAQNDTGVTSSLLSTMLWWLQEHPTRVFTVMTTNNKNSIPPELYREGRIDDVMLFQGLETKTQALEFAKHVFEATVKDIWEGAEPDFTNLDQTLVKEFSENGYVAQVKVVKEVHSLVKKMLLEVA